MSRITVLIDPSTAKESDCGMKFKLMNLDGMRRQKTSSALAFGTAVHKAIAKKLKGEYESLKQLTFDVCAEYAMNPDIDMRDNDPRTPGLLKKIIEDYFAVYQYEQFKCKPEHVELPFTYPFEVYPDLDVEFLLAGVVDRVGSCGHIPFAFQDTKTSSSNAPDYYLREYRMSFQMMTYAWVLKQMGFVDYYPPVQIDAIFIKSKSATGEVLFKRSDFIDYRDDLIEDHITWLRMRCRQIAESIRSGRHLRNFSRCQTVFGACEYFKYCAAQEAFRQGILDTEFIYKKYDPATFGD